MKILFLITIIFLMLPILIFAQKIVVDVPMSFQGSVPTIQVMVNGKGPFLFLVDTGAAGKARADTTLVQRLGLPKTGEDIASDTSGKNSVKIDEVRIETISIGGISFRDVKAFSRSYYSNDFTPNIDGILAFDLFSDYLLTLDYPNKRVRIERGELPKANGKQILTFEMQEGIPYIDVSVGSLKVKALVDSGSSYGITFPASLVKTLPVASYGKVIGRGKTTSNEFNIKENRLQDTISIGRFLFPEPTITYAEIFPELIIGLVTLREFAITFDQKNKRVRFVKNRKSRSKS